MKNALLKLHANTLFSNSFYPMLSTAIMAGLGFLFWLIVARLFSDAEVGLAATLISVLGTISVFSYLGFDTAIIRFLASENDKQALLDTGISVVAIGALVISGVFVVFVGTLSPNLSFLHEQPIMPVLFILFSMFAAINGFTDSIFLSYRKTMYTLITNTVFSTIKIGLPFFFIGYGAFGIFAAASLAQAIGCCISIGILIRFFQYRPKMRISKDSLTRVWRYGASNYAADIFLFLPVAILPILIGNYHGAEMVAYYFIVMLIVGLLYVIPSSTMRSLFAESSHDKKPISHVRETLQTTALFLLPAMAALLIGGKHILALFGAQYSQSGLLFLTIMVFVGIAVSAFTLYGSLFRITKNISALIIRNAVYASGLVAFSILLLRYGLAGVGIAYAIANVSAIFISHLLLRHERHTASLTSLKQHSL